MTTAGLRAIITERSGNARVVELADSLDSGSSAHSGRAGSSPASRTKPTKSEPDLPYGRRVRILCFLQETVFLQWCTAPSRIQAERAEKEEIKMIWRYLL